ncbi:MAG: alpha/beta hydrolase family protein [Leptotrichiaceae bacterium]|nr:alpha/beta hydrolase family protein [Leptotrichiaceae bacterium]
MKKILFILVFCCSFSTYSFTEKNIKIHSKSMKKDVPVTVVLPDGYSQGKKYGTIYVLHGWSGSNRDFPEKTSIGKLSDEYEVIYVSTDGNYDSWYIDSPIKKDSKYYTFISKELIEYIDLNFSTYNDKKHRAITGLSMGGFGAFYIGIKNQDTFGNIGSMSGGMDPEEYRGNWGIGKVLNNSWKEYNIKDIAHQLIGTKSNIIIDCGVDDFFIEPNRKLHKKFLDLNIKHEYIERPGGHSWEYWDNSIKYQTFFFNQKFNQK